MQFHLVAILFVTLPSWKAWGNVWGCGLKLPMACLCLQHAFCMLVMGAGTCHSRHIKDSSFWTQACALGMRDAACLASNSDSQIRAVARMLGMRSLVCTYSVNVLLSIS